MPGGLHAWENFSTPVPVRGLVKARTLLCYVALEASRRKELLSCGGYFDANIHFSYYTFYMYRKGKHYTFRRVLHIFIAHVIHVARSRHSIHRKRVVKIKVLSRYFYFIQQTTIMEVFRLN